MTTREIIRRATLPSLVVLVAALALLARGANEAQATPPFQPTLSTSLSASAAGATADITTTFNWGNGFANPNKNFPATFAGFTPAGWGIPDCSPTAACPYPNGAKTGSSSVVTTLGLLNSACAIPLPINFTGGAQPPYPGPTATTGLLNASTDPSDPTPLSPGVGFGNFTADVNVNGIMDGAEHWNTLLSNLIGVGALPPATVKPRERQIASTNLFGTTVWSDILTYNPGVLAPASLGFATLVITENFNPTLPAAPSLITDSCGLSITTTQLGMASNGAVHRSNPAAPGTKLFFLNSTSNRDADNDGIVNTNDTCPYTPNVGTPYNFAPVAFGPYPVGNGDAGETPGDGIDASCDPAPTTFGCGASQIGPSGADCDGDGYLNRQDNCPLAANGLATTNQQDVGEFLAGPPVDGGPTSDAIGDACDINPTVNDGSFAKVLNIAPVCVGLADSDGDGYCDATEVALGSNPASAASTPESLAIPTTCSDGKDNDGNGLTDLADPKCQKPNHDIAIRKFELQTDPVCDLGQSPPDSTGVFHLSLRNNGPASTETAQVGILLKAFPPSAPPSSTNPVPTPPASASSFPHKTAGSVVSVTTSTPGVTVTTSGPGTGAGPLNIDGDIDVEWLTKAIVSGLPAGQNVTLVVTVAFPACAAGPDVTPVDYLVTASACHGDDIAPLGLFGAGPCEAPNDGGQDRVNTANNAPVTVPVNDNSR